MGRNLDYDAARQLLEEQFALAEDDYQLNRPATVPESMASSVETLFQSQTQAFREALIGCCIARILDSGIDIRFPYMGQDDNAYNGRTLDERVINPFLHERSIPCSKAPFLSVFRRSVRFVPETREGVRDKRAFDEMLRVVEALRAENDDEANAIFKFVLYKFVELREQSDIIVKRIRRLSMEQQKELIENLLSTPSGGLLPVLIAVATFKSISDAYDLDWQVDRQGINVADAAKGAAGDITVTKEEDVLFSIEVTERPVDRDRVRSTFVTKMSPNNVEDYLFLLAGGEATEAAKVLARSYFSQGHEINFMSLGEWIGAVLALLRAPGRMRFNENVVELLRQRDIPASVKLAWNDCVEAVV